MAFLGIDPDSGLMAEGPTHAGRFLWQKPIVTLATLIQNTADLEKIVAHENLNVVPLLFREDYFDPVTRVRRGRLYQNQAGSQPYKWDAISGHPSGRAGAMYMCTYQSVTWRALGDPVVGRTNLALGTRDAYGLWSIVMVERTTGSSDLITLRARSTFGLLPKAEELDVQAPARGDIQKAIDHAVDAAHRQMADATVDACRHAAVAALSAWRTPTTPVQAEHRDLGQLIGDLERRADPPSVVTNSGRILARLHSRTKPNERKRYELRPNEDEDGQAAISLLGLMLREMRLAPA